MRTVLLAALLCLALPAAPPAKPAAAKAPAVKTAVAAPVPAAPAERPKAKPRVRIDTSYGAFVVELEPDLAPKSVANFLQYVKDGFYAGTVFHRVIEGFMIQGGGMTPELTEKPALAPIMNEAAETYAGGLKNTIGTLAMARTGMIHSATAQWYVNTADNVALDHHGASEDAYGYCVFGRVVEGMDVVRKIEKVRTIWRKGMQNVPEYAVRIKGAERLPE